MGEKCARRNPIEMNWVSVAAVALLLSEPAPVALTRAAFGSPDLTVERVVLMRTELPPIGAGPTPQTVSFNGATWLADRGGTGVGVLRSIPLF